MGLLIYLLPNKLSRAIQGDSSVESMYFGTKHRHKLYDNLKKTKEKVEQFKEKYLKTDNPKFFKKWKHYEGKKHELTERCKRQSKAEEGIEVKRGDGIVIEHPEYGKHF